MGSLLNEHSGYDLVQQFLSDWTYAPAAMALSVAICIWMLRDLWKRRLIQHSFRRQQGISLTLIKMLSISMTLAIPAYLISFVIIILARL